MLKDLIRTDSLSISPSEHSCGGCGGPIRDRYAPTRPAKTVTNSVTNSFNSFTDFICWRPIEHGTVIVCVVRAVHSHSIPSWVAMHAKGTFIAKKIIIGKNSHTKNIRFITKYIRHKKSHWENMACVCCVCELSCQHQVVAFPLIHDIDIFVNKNCCNEWENISTWHVLFPPLLSVVYTRVVRIDTFQCGGPDVERGANDSTCQRLYWMKQNVNDRNEITNAFWTNITSADEAVIST